MKENPLSLSNETELSAPISQRRRWRLTVRGIVQGVGFRPFVYNTARGLGLTGWVKNTSGQVDILVEGAQQQLKCFAQAIREKYPVQARIDALEVVEEPVGPAPLAEFQIIASTNEETVRPTIPADLALCDACRAEIRSPAERRYRYPFTNCTHCGPRWSIIQGLPYDRPRTSMAHFAMCPDCQAEYENPSDRRFHAQPIACPRCGPKLRLLVRADPHHPQIGRQPVGMPEHPTTSLPEEATPPKYVPAAEGDDALQQAAQTILEGKIVALKGLGGFQLLCDATQEEVVRELRRRKRRPDKPFALMFSHLDQVRQVCWVSEAEAQLLQSPEAPIVLLRRRKEPVPLDHPVDPKASGWQIAWAVAPGNPYLGVMLPYTPLHELLMESVGRPIVCTSGNLSEEPMASRTTEAIGRLGQIADLILTHNRPIVRPVDDSVVRVLKFPPEDDAKTANQQGLFGGEWKVSDGSGGVPTGASPPLVQVLRRARGYAPRPIDLPFEMPPILAVGAHLKNTVGLSLGSQVILSQHVGDLDNLPSLEVFQHTIEDLLRFFRVEPDRVVCDLHPDYASTQYAEHMARQWQVPLLRVQHHEAHLAACLAEQGLPPEALAEPILGFSWDGAGYGRDGAIWGGEMLLWHSGRVERVGSLWSFPLPGGDQAVRQPRRSALAVLYELLGDQAWEKFPTLKEWFSPMEQTGLRSMLRRGVNCPRTTSMGRLFDAAAALCGLGQRISFEGQAAMALEFAALEDSPKSKRHPPPKAWTPVAISAELLESLPGYPLPWIEGDEKSDPSKKTAPKPPEKADREVGFGLLDWRPMLEAILADRAAGVPVGEISRRFHAALVEGALKAAHWAAKQWGVRQVALSGGCFQNALLSQWAYQRLHQAGFTVYLHQQTPPGDGGIALGQIMLAAAWTHLNQ